MLALTAVLFASPAVGAPHGLHYAPGENLEALDVDALDEAVSRIDLAAYVLTDVAVIDALQAAALRGVEVRIFLDGTGRNEPVAAFFKLASTPGVAIRTRRPGARLMHLKAYAVDGFFVRTGSANFLADGLKRQANEATWRTDADDVERFEVAFERMWTEPGAE